MNKIIFGNIEGYQAGDWFEDRLKMKEVGMHRRHGSGMDWDIELGTAAIVLEVTKMMKIMVMR